MGPRRNTPLGGIFVSQRILALKKMGVDIIPVNAGITYSPVTRLLLGLKNIHDGGNLAAKQLGVHYQVIRAEMNLLDT